MVSERRNRSAILRRMVLAAVLTGLTLSTVTATPASADHLTCSGVLTTIDGTPGDDVINGTPGDDVIQGDGGDDVINGLGGNDRICGGDGNDTLNGGDGNDRLEGGEGFDFLGANFGLGEPGDDILIGGADPDQIGGGDGNDVLDGGPGQDHLDGGPGNDIIDGGGGFDQLNGGDGDDALNGGEGADFLDGGPGNDIIDGGGGDGFDEVLYFSAPGPVTVNLTNGTASGHGMDTLIGIAGVRASPFDDTLIGDDGPVNLLTGGPGNDTIEGRGGFDQIEGGEGDDILNGGDGSSDLLVFGSATGPVMVNLATGTSSGEGIGTDTLIDFENVLGTSFDDTFIGDAGNNAFLASRGNDTLDGGDGVDFVEYRFHPQAVTVNLANGTATGESIDTDTLIAIENVGGTNSDDSLIGDAANNVLLGRDGDDFLDGGPGNDHLDGGEGTDTCVPDSDTLISCELITVSDSDGDGIPDAKDTEGPLVNTNGIDGANDCTDGVDNDGNGLTDGADPGCAAPPCGARQIIFVRGIKFTFNDDGMTRNSKEWGADFTEIAGFLKATFGYTDNDFRWFNYSTAWTPADGETPTNGSFNGADTRQAISTSAAQVGNQVDFWSGLCPDSRFDIIAHSLAGAVTAYWAGTAGSTELSKVHAILTIESPLGGIPVANCPAVITLGSFGQVAGQAGIDLCSGAVKETMKVGLNRVPFLVVNNRADAVVNGCAAQGFTEADGALNGTLAGRVWDSFDFGVSLVPTTGPLAGALNPVIGFLSFKACATVLEVSTLADALFASSNAHVLPLSSSCGCWPHLIPKLVGASLVDDGSPAIDYSGAWKQRPNSARIMATITASSEAFDSAKFTIPEDAQTIVWITARGPFQGRASVRICGEAKEDEPLRGTTDVRVELSYQVPDICPIREFEIAVLPDLVTPGGEICSPDIQKTITLPFGRIIVIEIPGHCVTIPEVTVTGEVQVDGFEVSH